MAVDTLPNVGLTCDPRPFKAGDNSNGDPGGDEDSGLCCRYVKNDAKRNLDLNT